MPKVHIAPTPAQHPLEGGILRVVNAMRRHLPAFGWEVVDDPHDADVINTHSVMSYPDINDKPIVQSSHGLMWHEYWPNGEWDSVNADLVAAMKRADAITAPSQWVARAIARGIACQPVVIHHGVDIEDWTPVVRQAHDDKPTQGYALWNKARGDNVSDYHEVERLAALMPDVSFLSTLGKPTSNLKICGTQSYADIKHIVAEAGVYLALPRETFGIGTLEAMACGVPVAGWDYGGQREIIRNGETGYLAAYGDWDGLANCIRRCLAERSRLGANARTDAYERWGWQPRIAQYADLFDSLIQAEELPKVSVIVTSYQLGRFLPAALESVAAQTMDDWEIVIVDDQSTDNTWDVIQEWWAKDERIRFATPDSNIGLPAARNYGIAQARGQYIIPLDADDLLAPDALEILSKALDADKGLHIAYGHLDVMSEDGNNRQRSGWTVEGFDYAGQLAHRNQLHYSAMMRRSIFERTQGYRRRSWQAEDAEFWGYATSFGFNAQRVTDKSTLIYRIRSGSKSSTNQKMGTQFVDGDWSAWYTWRDRPENTPFGAQGKPADGKFWRVPHNADPEVSIIIPVGPGHETVLQDALDSVMAQTFTKWEVCIVNDTGREIDSRGYGFAHRINTSGQRGSGFARNLGAASARSPLLVFLDADDLLQPTFLETVIAAYRAESTPALIYTDWHTEYGQGNLDKVWETTDWNWRALKKGMINCVTCLIPKAAHEAIGGFDESLTGFEDFAYMLALAEYGLCGLRVPQPLMTYRKQTGMRNTAAMPEKDALYQRIMKPYWDYFEGRKVMACSSCGGGRAKVATPMGTPPPAGKMLAAPQDGMKMLEYIGSNETTNGFIGKKTQTTYRFGASQGNTRRWVFAADLPHFLNMAEPGRPGQPIFREVAAPNAAVTPAPMQPLVVRDRVVPPPAPRAQFTQPVSPQPIQAPPTVVVNAMPPRLPQAPRPTMAVQPIPLTPWEIEDRKKRGVPVNAGPAKSEDGMDLPNLDAMPAMANLMERTDGTLVQPEQFAPAPHAVEVASVADKPFLAQSYLEIRNGLDKVNAQQAREYLAAEQASARPRQGVVKLLTVHIEAQEA